MSNWPLVSIIVPFWNAPASSGVTSEGVVAQAFDAWWLTLVNHGSSDGITQIAERLPIASRGRSRYHQPAGHHNRGVGASRDLAGRPAAGRRWAR
jgi:glycosyltransferase involved in cell wall biosynthesis